MIFLG
jgi:hypothetical protein